MNVLFQLPASPRTLHAVRGAINERARIRGVAEDQRRHAVVHALHVMQAGGSSAWATQAGLQELAAPARRVTGGAA